MLFLHALLNSLYERDNQNLFDSVDSLPPKIQGNGPMTSVARPWTCLTNAYIYRSTSVDVSLVLEAIISTTFG
jgi:hypothetical protein